MEVYIPDRPNPAYQNVLDTLELEFTYVYGGCTILRGLDGSYLARDGRILRDRINLIYTDSLFTLSEYRDTIEEYADQVRKWAHEALEEEAILVVVVPVYHAD